MSIRYVLCPVIDLPHPPDIDPDTPRNRAPKIETIIDPARGKPYQWVGAVDAANWCVCFVRSADFSALDADADCINLLEGDFAGDRLTLLTSTSRQLGFSGARLTRIRARLENKGVDTTGWTLDTPLETILDAVMKKVAPEFKARHTWFP